MPPLLPDEATKAQETFRLGDRFYVEEHGLVLGELMNSLGLFPFMRRLNYYDLDDINLESGIYGINNTGGRKDAPSNDSTGISLGMIIIFNGKGMSLGGNPVVQIAVEYMANSIKVRTYWSTKWYEWVQIATL